MRLTEQQLFGDGFYQDLETIRISKSALGLDSGTHAGTAIYAALVLKALANFEGTVTGNGQPVTGNGQFVTYKNYASDRLTLFFWKQEFFTNKAGQPIARTSYVLELLAGYVVNDDDDDQQIQPSDLT